MKRELLIERTPDLIRTALLEDGKLCEIHQERIQQRKLTDTLFLGRIQAIRPAVNAAFIDIGEELNAFLPLREGSSLRCGDEIIVQGSAVQAVETKGLRVTDTINLAGKWLVLIPGEQGVRISKKIKDPDLRKVLTHVMESLCPDGCGIIVRTASAEITEEQLATEVHELYALWMSIKVKAKGMRKPGVLHETLDLMLRMIRDIGATLDGVITNSEECLLQIKAVMDSGWLSPDTEIRLFDEKDSLMTDVFSVDVQIDKALKKRVWLPCGGYLVFDVCEALTVIDVNSGKMTLGRDIEALALCVNLEAAQEIARQLRLRDIGGIIVVDYIDMKDEANRERLLQEIHRLSLADRSQIVVGGITKFGLVEMTRKRKNVQLDKALQTTCKVCGGQGRFLSPEEIAFRALRQVRRMVISGQRGPFLVRIASSVWAALSGMTAVPGADVYVCAENGKHAERYEIEQLDIAAGVPKGAVQLKKE